MDIRNLPDTGHENISFLKMDLMKPNLAYENITESISILHAIEHFGLGRYGDPINPNGHIHGFNNILKMLKPEGTLYISFPISIKNRVFFNAHRMFHPTDILTWANDPNSIELMRFDYVDDKGHLHKQINLQTGISNLRVSEGCGIYTFKKIK